MPLNFPSKHGHNQIKICVSGAAETGNCGIDALEKAKEAAIREGIEAAGIKPLEMEFISISRCGGSFEWDLYYFLVKKYEIVGQKLEEHEKIESIQVSRDELLQLALSGGMQEDRSVAVVLKYLYKKDLI